MLEDQQESQQTSVEFETIVEHLEKGYYLKPEFNSLFENEVRSKIEEFSHWFNSTARLYFLKCGPTESKTIIYLLLNLKKKLQFAISETNKSVSKRRQSYICNVCGEKIDVQPCQNTWDKIQDHQHFEECYSKIFDDTANTVEDLTEESSQVTLPESLNNEKSQDDSVNDLTFNFEVAYDERVEKTLYPETLVKAAQKADHFSDYTVQRHDIDNGVCLLCPCSIIAKGKKGKICKMTPFVVKSHVYGRKHLKNASAAANQGALKKYHEFWRRQDAIYQAHQVYFIPEISAVDRCKCQLCSLPIQYGGIINHIKTNKLHKIRVFKIFHSPKEKLNDFSLLDMQVKMYDDPKKEKKPETAKKKVSRTAARGKCVFVKFVPNPNQVNLPTRYKGHSEFFTRSVNLVRCRICTESCYNSSTVIRRHIQSAQHQQLSGIPLEKYNFFCDICTTHLEDEDAWDNHFMKGSNNHDSFSRGGRIKLAEYECSTCNFVIYGDQSSLNSHILRRSKEADNDRKRKAEMELMEVYSRPYSPLLTFLQKKKALQNKATHDEDLTQEMEEETTLQDIAMEDLDDERLMSESEKTHSDASSDTSLLNESYSQEDESFLSDAISLGESSEEHDFDDDMIPTDESDQDSD